ncbi:hypothetical protein GF391_03170 [Candidatus Uhrbacteria bacterium]|nr:hypothetical protein [Candidatus Uhrbacteria bacterium]
MKKSNYILIPFAKWIASFLVINIVIFGYVYTTPIAPWVDLVIGWSLSALIAAPFAYWAFKSKLPGGKELGLFILFWVIVTFVSETAFAFAFQPDPFLVVVRYEFLVQTVFEIAAILVMAKVMRRQYAYHMAAPGIDLDESNQI